MDGDIALAADGRATSRASRPQGTITEAAVADLVDGLFSWQLWSLMGWQDIKQRYRRSLLGPFWLTLSMAILVGTLGVLYGRLFGVDIDSYLPFLTLGFLSWTLLSTLINDGCGVFTSSESFIKQMRLPFSLFVYRIVWRNIIIFAHNFVIYLVVAPIFGIWAGSAGLLFLPGLALIVLNGVWVALLLGMLCARFRDIPQIVASLLQVAFFLTPIIWKPDLLGRHAGIVDLNPFYHFVELVRAPLLGQPPSAFTWVTAVAVLAVGWLTTFLFFRRFRARIAYWV